MALPAAEIGKRIRAVREQLGLTLRDLCAALGVDESTAGRLENGSLDPIPGDYILIAARLLHTDFRYFISTELDDVEQETRELFRALAEPTAADRRAIRRFMYFCTCERELEEILSVQQASLAPTYGHANGLHKHQGAAVAERERQRLGLGEEPIENIFGLLRSQGIRLFRHAMQKSDLSGLTALHPRAGVCVLVNYDHDLFRQFFSASHEYAHVLFDREEVNKHGYIVSFRYNKKDLLEIRANAFAAEFLLPRAALSRYAWPHEPNHLANTILQVARDYHVNTETVAIRLKEAGKITANTLASFQKARPVTVPRAEKRDPEIPADLSPTQRERRTVASEQGISSYYLNLLRQAFTQDQISLGRLAEMLDLGRSELADFIQQTGMAL